MRKLLNKLTTILNDKRDNSVMRRQLDSLTDYGLIDRFVK